MRQYSLQDILLHIPEPYKIVGNSKRRFFTNIKPILESNEESLVFINSDQKEKVNLVKQTKAHLIICDSSISVDLEMLQKKCLIMVDNPKIAIARIASALFKRNVEYGIHSTAFVHPDVQLHPQTYIGPFSYIGRCIIGKGTIIHGHSYLYDDVEIGNNVVIHAGCVLGSAGFGFSRDEKNGIYEFPHIGKVIIDDDVELQADCHVSRGALGDTIIGKGSKFDSGCHIAHNVKIGKYCLVAAHAMIAGSVIIGNYVWIGPCAVISDYVTINDNANISIGAVVTRNVNPYEHVSGNFAINHAKFIQFIKRIR